MAQPISAPVSPIFLPLQILLIAIDLLVSERPVNNDCRQRFPALFWAVVILHD